jgi:hypothetical protein
MSTLTHAASGIGRTLEAAPLGALLVSRGLLSEADLAEALAEQDRAPRPLGAILVDRGLVRPAVVAQALATQHGAVLKTEYGFATGFDRNLSGEETAAEPPVSPATVGFAGLLRHAADDIASPPPPPAPLQPAPPPPTPTEALAGVAVAAIGQEAVELELASAVAENEKLRARLGEMQLAGMRLRSESEAARQEAAVAGARVAGLEAAIAALHAERDQLRARADELQQSR